MKIKDLETITTRELIKTFETNIFSYFWITKAALPHMKKSSCIINSSSVTAYRGSGSLMDYAATKGAIVAFTRSLSSNLAKKGIRVNGVAPGPIWTPLIPSSFQSKKSSPAWKRCSDAKSRRTCGNSAQLSFSGQLRCQLYDRAIFTSQWWRNNKWVKEKFRTVFLLACFWNFIITNLFWGGLNVI